MQFQVICFMVKMKMNNNKENQVEMRNINKLQKTQKIKSMILKLKPQIISLILKINGDIETKIII